LKKEVMNTLLKIATVLMVIVVIIIVFLVVENAKPPVIIQFGALNASGNFVFLVDSDVYLGDRFVGTTEDGSLAVKARDCTNATVRFIPDLKGIHDELRFEQGIDCNRPVNRYIVNSKIAGRLLHLSMISRYIDAIVIDRTGIIMQHAVRLARDCEGDITCQTYSVFRYVVENIRYFLEPEGVENIQGPFETERIMAGDCEDQSILLASYLESLGIKTKLVSSGFHVYVMVCDLDPDNVEGYFWQSVDQHCMRDIECWERFFKIDYTTGKTTGIEKEYEIKYYSFDSEKNCFVLDPSYKELPLLGYNPTINSWDKHVAVDVNDKTYEYVRG